MYPLLSLAKIQRESEDFKTGVRSDTDKSILYNKVLL